MPWRTLGLIVLMLSRARDREGACRRLSPRREGQGHPAAARHPARHRAGAAGTAARTRDKGYRIVQVVPGTGEMSVPVAAKPGRSRLRQLRSMSRRSASRRLRQPRSPWSSRWSPCPRRRRQFRARRRHCGRSHTAVHLGIATVAQHADAGKFVTTEPGGWPPAVSVPVPRAGGIGASSAPASARRRTAASRRRIIQAQPSTDCTNRASCCGPRPRAFWRSAP